MSLSAFNINFSVIHFFYLQQGPLYMLAGVDTGDLILHKPCSSLYISQCSTEQSWVQMEINIQFPLSPQGGTAFKPPSFGLQVPNYILKKCVQGLLLDLQLI